MFSSSLLSVLPLALFVVAPLVAAILAGALTRGRVRALGVAGFGVFVVQGVLGIVWFLMVPRISGSMSMTAVAGVYSALRGVMSLAALALLLLAVVVDRRPPVPPPPYRS